MLTLAEKGLYSFLEGGESALPNRSSAWRGTEEHGRRWHDGGVCLEGKWGLKFGALEALTNSLTSISKGQLEVTVTNCMRDPALFFRENIASNCSN